MKQMCAPIGFDDIESLPPNVQAEAREMLELSLVVNVALTCILAVLAVFSVIVTLFPSVFAVPYAVIATTLVLFVAISGTVVIVVRKRR